MKNEYNIGFIAEFMYANTISTGHNSGALTTRHFLQREPTVEVRVSGIQHSRNVETMMAMVLAALMFLLIRFFSEVMVAESSLELDADVGTSCFAMRWACALAIW